MNLFVYCQLSLPLQRASWNVHLLARLDVELPRPQEPQHGQSIKSFRVSRLLEHGTQLVYLRILLFGGVAWVAGLCLG